MSEIMVLPMGREQEASLIERMKAGDENAFVALYKHNRARVYGVCKRMMGNHEDAEDATQEVFLRFHRKVGTFKGKSALGTWLHRIAVRIVLMHQRSRKNRHHESLDAMREMVDGGSMAEIGVTDRYLACTRERLALLDAFVRMPKGFRTAFVLHDVRGFRHAEIARIRNTSIGCSKSQLFRARRRLQETLLGSASANDPQRSFGIKNGK